MNIITADAVEHGCLLRRAMKPLVSILIPAFNAQEFLADTVKSALAQTWERKEIIIVDDGSRDRTLSIARSFECDSVKVVTQANQGAAATRNHAFSLAQGDYVQWLDADDLLGRDKIRLQMERALQLADPKWLISSEWAYFMYRPHKAQFTPSLLWNDLSAVEWMTRKMEQNLFMQTGTWLVSRALTDAAGPWNTKLLGDDDGEYFARVLMAGKGVKFVAGSRVYYRISPASRLSYIGHNPRKMEAQLHSMELNIGYLRSLEDSPRVRQACITYLNNWQINFYPERPDLVQRAHDLAKDLGGTLPAPTLSWKYAWIQKVFGWSSAKRAQSSYNQWKARTRRSFDGLLHRLEGGSETLARGLP